MPVYEIWETFSESPALQVCRCRSGDGETVILKREAVV
jgi:hypothetical protein